MQDEVMPRLKSHFALHANIHRTMITAGLAESMLAECIAAWENALPQSIKLAYLPSPNVVRLRLSAYDVEDADATRKTIDALFDSLYDIIPQYIVGFEDASVQGLVHNLLIERGLTLAAAESCTGGHHSLALHRHGRRLGILPARCRHIQQRGQARRAGVNYDDIMRYGAVSETVARQMAEGARRYRRRLRRGHHRHSGPHGGTPEKPVGTVCSPWPRPRARSA